MELICPKCGGEVDDMGTRYVCLAPGCGWMLDHRPEDYIFLTIYCR